MSVFKMIDESYKEMEALENLINYAVKEEHCKEGVYGAQGLLKRNPEEMLQQMYDTKHAFHKTGGRQAKHFILSFSKEEEEFIGLDEALAIGYTVAGYFPKWQIVFGVHTNTDNLHIHFVMNTVSFEDGLKFNMGFSELHLIKRDIGRLIDHFYHLKHQPLFTRVLSTGENIEELLTPKPSKFPCK